MEIKHLQIVKSEDNSNELFRKWNIQNQTNVKCSNSDCFRCSEDNAYIVKDIGNSNKFITPLCINCYEWLIRNSSPYINIEENLLMEADEV
jgi:hypothetical protein